MGTYFSNRFDIQAPDDNDPFADVALRLRGLVDHLDYLLGENGETNIVPSAANTTTTKRINYSRDYSAIGVPLAFVRVNETVASTSAVWVWTTGEDATGFTLNIRADGTASRAVRWFIRPPSA